MDLKLVESVSIRRAKDELSDLLRQVEAGAQFLIMRRLEPAGALISHADFQRFQELLRREGLAEALLRGRGIEATELSTDRFIDLLDRHVKTNKGG